MDPSRKRALGDGSSNGGDSSKIIQMVPHSDKKKVCRYCKREFKCGRGLGGHIKFHTKGRKMTKFSTRMNNRSGFRSFSAPPSLRRSSQVRGGEITDLSKFLNGTGWKVQKKRGANEARGKGVVVAPYSSSDDDDDYIECDEFDSCDEDDYDSIRLRKKLRRRGIIGNAHNICWTRRMLMCKVCDKFFRTYYALLCHVSEYLPIEGGEKEDGKKGEEADRVAAAEEREGDAEGGVEKKEQGKEDVVIGDNNDGFGGVEGEKSNEEKGNEVEQVVGEAAAAEKNEEDAEGVAEVGGKEVQGKEDVITGDNNEGFGGVEGEKENGEKGEEVEQVVGEAAAAAVKHEGDTEGCIEVGERKDQGKDVVMGEKESEEKGEEVEQVVDEGDAAEEKEGDAEGGDKVGGKEEQGKEDVVMGERESEEKGEEVEQVVGEGDAEGGVEAGEKEEQGEDVVMGEKESEEKGEEVEEQVVGEGAAAEEQEGDAEDSVEFCEMEEQGKEDVVMGEEVGEKEEEEKEDVVMEDNNDEGFGSVEEEMDTKEFNEEVAEMGEKSGGGGSMDEQMSTPVAPPKMLEFDLNEMPPEED